MKMQDPSTYSIQVVEYKNEPNTGQEANIQLALELLFSIQELFLGHGLGRRKTVPVQLFLELDHFNGAVALAFGDFVRCHTGCEDRRTERKGGGER